ncbi:MAG: hypothetical protein M5U26_16545 [Planctomycetota bacterium]|nr:hypothetical protein [Planctomycetota bacterium]
MAEAPAPASHRTRVLLAACNALLVALPFLLVEFPPVADMSQQVTQVRMYLDERREPTGGFELQAPGPNRAGYLWLGAFCTLFGFEHGGRIGTLALAVLWVACVHYLAARRQRAPEWAVLGSLWFFSFLLYWGLYNFMLGFCAFLGALACTMPPREGQPERPLARDLPLTFGFALLLAFCHVGWLHLLAVWTLFAWLMGLDRARRALPRLGAMLLVLAAAQAWVSLHATTAKSVHAPTVLYATQPFERLSPAWIVYASLGGLRGPWEAVALAAALALAAAALVCARHRPKYGVESSFLWLGGALLVAVFVLPDRVGYAIEFSTRWMPPALTLLVLGLPALPVAGRVPAWAIPAAGLALFVAVTCAAWRAVEREELSGVRPALEALPERARVVGLDFVRDSRYIERRPFLHVFAWAGAWKGARLNFDFTHFRANLVARPEDWTPPWTRGLEWKPELLHENDLKFFDYAILGGAGEIHATVGNQKGFVPVTDTGIWRLYRIESSRLSPGAAAPAP